MKNLSVTGLNGFIGKNIKKILSSFFHIFPIDINSSIVENNEAIIHLAAISNNSNFVSADLIYNINTNLAIQIFEKFINSDSKTFIILSSVKAVAESTSVILTEDHFPNPSTHYGKSKFLAEKYILNRDLPNGKRVFILRPCMVYAPGSKKNLNLLYSLINKGVPWPLGSFNNKRSFCSIDNLCFIIKELIENENIPSGIYNIADDEPISTNEIIDLIGESTGRKSIILNIPKFFVESIAKLGDFLKLPLNTERLSKLTETYIVDNSKIKNAIGKSLPISIKEGLLKTFKSFNQNV